MHTHTLTHSHTCTHSQLVTLLSEGSLQNPALSVVLLAEVSFTKPKNAVSSSPPSPSFPTLFRSFIHYSSSSFCNIYSTLPSSSSPFFLHPPLRSSFVLLSALPSSSSPLFLHPPLHSSFVLLSILPSSSSPLFFHPLASSLLSHFSLIYLHHFSFIPFFISPPSPPLSLEPLLQEPPQEANLKISGMLPPQWSRRSRQPTPNSPQQ